MLIKAREAYGPTVPNENNFFVALLLLLPPPPPGVGMVIGANGLIGEADTVLLYS